MTGAAGEAGRAVPEKWRPPLRLIAAGLIAFTVLLPLVSLLFLRLYENLLVRETEAALIGQAAVIAATASALGEGLSPGAVAPPGPKDGALNPIEPRLDLSRASVLPPRPDSLDAEPLSAAERALGEALTPILSEAQQATLAGFRVTNRQGVVIAGGGEVGRSLGAVPEVQVALGGRARASLRDRFSDEPPPPLSSLSRGTRVRVFVALPIMREGRVVGAVLASRTPQNVLRDLYRQRGRVALAAGLTAFGAALVGFVFVRGVGRPIVRLQRQAARIARNPEAEVAPLGHYGSREVADLARSVGDMARALRLRGDSVRTFAQHVTHELKSPLTAILGAAEVLRDDLGAADRARFLGRIEEQAGRMDRLLGALRDLARAEAGAGAGSARLSEAVAGLRGETPLELTLSGDAVLPLPPEDVRAVLTQLAANAAQAGAQRLAIEASPGRVVLRDDGPGVAPGDASRLFEPFFTTRAAEGGTGMGLGIARAMLRARGGELTYEAGEKGACFVLTFGDGL